MAISRALGLQSEPNRWLQPIACVFAMMAIANLEYAWRLSATPLSLSLHASFTLIQVAFAVLISTQTRLLSVDGCVWDRPSLREVIAIHCALAGMGWGRCWIGATREVHERLRYGTRCFFGGRDLYGRLILLQKPPRPIAFKSERHLVSECGPKYGTQSALVNWEEVVWLPKMQLSNSETAPCNITAA